jgi:hypothetical protein
MPSSREVDFAQQRPSEDWLAVGRSPAIEESVTFKDRHFVARLGEVLNDRAGNCTF